MASTTFPSSTSGIVFSGSWEDAYQAGAGCKLTNNWYATIDFAVTGTDCAMNFAVASLSSITLQVSVDGGAFTNITLPGSINTYLGTATNNIFTGLPEATRTITVKISGSNVEFFFLHAASAFTVTGAAPAISTPANFTGATIYDVADLIGLGGVEGNWAPLYDSSFSFGYTRPTGLIAKFQDASVKFRSNATALKVFTYLNSARLKVIQDGAAAGSVVQMTAANSAPASSANTMGWVQLVGSLDGAYHTYQFVACDANQPVLAQVMAVGGTIDLTTTYPRRGGIGFVGDSKTAALTGTGNDSTLGFAWKLGQLKNRQVFNGGIGSTFLQSGGGSTPGTSVRFTDGTALGCVGGGAPLDYLVFEIGLNDANAASPPPNANMLAVYTSMLQRARRTVGPNCKILALGFLPTTATNAAANRTAFNTNVVQQAVTNVADANTTYVSTDSVFGTAGAAPTAGQINANTTDGVHPNPAGNTVVRDFVDSYITVWAPSGGSAGGFADMGL